MLASRVTLPDLTFLSTDAIQELITKHALSLTVAELLSIQKEILGRPPTIAEAVLWSIQGSEHCSYRSSRHLLKTLPTTGKNVILGPNEDAGIVAVATDKHGLRYGITLSHESHNHPSQLVPYEGAATGVGGNIRDVNCMGAEVIAIADGLRFGEITDAKTRWLFDGVVAGIAGYGNPVGVPTIAGDLYFDAGYNNNCLVTVVTLGVVREDKIIHSYAPKNAENHVFILVGKPTDNSGFGGASFASKDFESDNSDQSSRGAVQEPNAFLERHLLKSSYKLFEKIHAAGLTDKVGFKDLGAGGIACASVELADSGGYGAEIDLDKVPCSMQDLAAHVVLCAETQERFMWVVPRDCVDMIVDHYNIEFSLPEVSVGACAVVVGSIRTDGLYIVNSQNEEIVRAKASDVTAGIRQERAVKKSNKKFAEPTLQKLPDSGNELLLKLLAHENIASRAAVFERYDKQVQGRTIVEAGVADSGILQPFNDDSYPLEIQKTAVALSLDQNPRFNHIDPYWGAINAVLEAARNVAAVGAKPIAISDCLCYGNPEKPEQMWEFNEAIRGLKDVCTALTVPIISGNVSFYNESPSGAIPASPMIGCLGVIKNIDKHITGSFIAENSVIMLTSPRVNECGGSVYYLLNGELGANVPKPDLVRAKNELSRMHTAIENGWVRSAHDIADGGLAVTLAEMSFANSIGCEVLVSGDLPADKKLFSESGGFVLEVAPKHLQSLEQLFAEKNIKLDKIGKTTSTAKLKIQNWIDLEVTTAKLAFNSGLQEKLIG